MEQDMGASDKSDRATAVEPVPVSSLRDGIPSAKEVVRQMLYLSHRAPAVALCGRLEAEGYSKANAQLAITRAIEAGHVFIMDDLSLALPNPDYVSNSPRADRLGRPLRTIAQAIEARSDKTRRGLAEGESAVTK